MGILGTILGGVAGAAVGFAVGGPGGAIKGAQLGAGLGGTIGGTAGATAAAGQASQQQVQALREQQAFLQQQAEIGREAFAPFQAAGGTSQAFQLQQAFAGALGPEAQQQAFAQFQEDPGTQFLRQRGIDITNKRASALGGLGGGNRLRALSEFNQGLALQNLGNRFNQLGAITGTQLAAAGGFANVGTALAPVTGQAIGQQGVAQAAGTIGAQQAQLSGLSGLARLAPQVAGFFQNMPATGGGGLGPGGASIVPDFSSQLITPSFAGGTT